MRPFLVLFEVFEAEALAPLIGPYDGVLGTGFFRDFVLQIPSPTAPEAASASAC